MEREKVKYEQKKQKKQTKRNWFLISHCLWKYVKRIISFRMICLSLERIFWGKRRLVLPILVIDERLPHIFFRSGAYISNNQFAKLFFPCQIYISTTFKGVPRSTCHLARIVCKRQKNWTFPQCISEHLKFRLFHILMVQPSNT